MLSVLKNNQSNIYTFLTGLFFILILHFKVSYTAIPIILSLSGLYFIIVSIKNKTFKIQPENKLLVITFISYFLLFVLSFILHNGKTNELDLPSRALFVLPLFALFTHIKIKPLWIIYAIIIACFIAGIVAGIQRFYLHIPYPFPQHLKIQAGDIAITLALFSLCISFYFYQLKNNILVIISSIAFILSFMASLLTLTRGALVGFFLTILVVMWLYRHLFSKKIITLFIIFLIIVGGASYKIGESQWRSLNNNITNCLKHNKCSTSSGARLDMYKSAIRGMDEKPLFGWGLEGVKEMRKQHFEQGYISKLSSTFNHSHNQFLHDGSARGVLGLLALLAIFFVPFSLFLNGLKRSSNKLSQLFGTMGITHIIATMGYCLTQSFLSHNSGTMFYFTSVIILLSLQRIARKEDEQ
ncbi:O-antigen ligase family protein [Phocoenobacter skyensis]|uniref:O-antigen ligase n=1 Tax=Phocoenobacter skyensis TaxID=97481 RepID=A0A1H7XFT0_9PAST|nr:O-antigen ligase family protein [Pasteurella skyensis]MDP8079675.1 O-antigen ligase family protein [Pasteurella skyensis]MDP8085625.1 O-antigen ligase family protein [Pasteurella skyensis]MDP8185392.1 O-antigen ligase family protein [Pasteurella skyensis]QLB22157.1 hypothetical protein A6B44_02660 [Pasteurella skyensis]SEM31899.1 O-antigen ligase [Pasteurella skyensis]